VQGFSIALREGGFGSGLAKGHIQISEALRETALTRKARLGVHQLLSNGFGPPGRWMMGAPQFLEQPRSVNPGGRVLLGFPADSLLLRPGMFKSTAGTHSGSRIRRIVTVG